MAIIDNIILFLFLGYTLYYLIKKGSKDSNINTYSIGKREFSTLALVATITATFTSGSGFITHFSYTYKEGLKHIVPVLGVIIYAIFMVCFIVPKCKKVLGETSVASAMGEKYGILIQNIIAITGIIGGCASISVQIKIFGMFGQYFYPNIPELVFCGVGTLFVVSYSALGGITHVVRTDIIQAITFSLALIILVCLTVNDASHHTYTSELNLDRFNINFLGTFSEKDWFNIFMLFLFFAIPTMSPATFQRLSMGISVKHLKESWTISSIIQIIIVMLSCILGMYFAILKPGIEYKNLLGELVNYYTIPGLKGLLLVGILSMVMSTADSYLNISSVLIANDIYHFAKNFNDIQKLYIARIATFVLGLFCFAATYFYKNLLDIVFMFKGFYVPVATIPILAYIFEFNISKKSIYLAMFSGLAFVITCRIIKTSFEPIMAGLIVNLIVLTISTLYFKYKKT